MTNTKSSAKSSPAKRATPAKAGVAAKPERAAKAKAAAKPVAKPKAKPAPRTAAKQSAPKTRRSRAPKPVGVPPEQRRYYVEVAAYHIAERRGFAPGDPLEDWVQAEAEIDRLLAAGKLGG